MTRPPTLSGDVGFADPKTIATLLPKWRRTAERWRLTRGEAAALLRIPRATLVGVTPTGSLAPITAARMVALVALDEVLLARTGSPALTTRWIRFPSTTYPERRRLDIIADSDDFLQASLRLMLRDEK